MVMGMLTRDVQGVGQATNMVPAGMPQANTWLGHGARPYTDVEAAPGKYYVPSKHPYQATLPGGIKVQEAYPGQYYVPGPVGVRGGASGFGQVPAIALAPWICALIGAAIGGAGGFYGGKALSKGPAKKKTGMYAGAGGAAAGALAGYYLCKKRAKEAPPPAVVDDEVAAPVVGPTMPVLPAPAPGPTPLPPLLATPRVPLPTPAPPVVAAGQRAPQRPYIEPPR